MQCIHVDYGTHIAHILVWDVSKWKVINVNSKASNKCISISQNINCPKRIFFAFCQVTDLKNRKVFFGQFFGHNRQELLNTTKARVY